MRGLGRVRDLARDNQAEFEADIVSREDFLSRHEQRSLAEVYQFYRPAKAPDDVTTCVVAPHKQAVMIYKSRPAFGHVKCVSEFLDDRRSNHTREDGGGNDRMIDLPYGLRVVGCGYKTTTHKRRRKFGQEAGICTRTVAFTTRSAAITPRS